MTLTRTLRLGSAGEDVLLLKERLLKLGCYDPRIAQIQTSVFGKDTQNAVKTFQAKNALVADGMARDPQEGLEIAKEGLLSGKAAAKLQQIVSVSSKL